MIRNGVSSHYLGMVVVSVTISLLLTGCADLLVRDVRTAPFTGPMLQLKVTVANQGMRAAPASETSVAWGASEAGPFTTLLLATPALAPNAEHVIAPIPYPSTPQTCYVRVCADANNVVGEGALYRQNNRHR